MTENLNKLAAAFLAGRLDASAEQHTAIPEGVESLLRMVLSDSDCTSLAQFSTVFFKPQVDRLHLVSAISVPMGSRNGQTHAGVASTS